MSEVVGEWKPDKSHRFIRQQTGVMEEPHLGVIRLAEFNYDPIVGDIDSEESFGYPVKYEKVEGLTFKLCQQGKQLKGKIKQELLDVVKEFDKDPEIKGITGDCGFMLHYQNLVSAHTTKPVFMSSLCALPMLVNAFPGRRGMAGQAPPSLIAVLTANQKTFLPLVPKMKEILGLDIGFLEDCKKSDSSSKGKVQQQQQQQELKCSLNGEKERLLIVDCSQLDGFKAVLNGKDVDSTRVEPAVVEKCRGVIERHPKQVRAFLFECTELPAYSNAVRKMLHDEGHHVPVYDAISVANSFMNGFRTNKLFGEQYTTTKKPARADGTFPPAKRQKLANGSS